MLLRATDCGYGKHAAERQQEKRNCGKRTARFRESSGHGVLFRPRWLLRQQGRGKSNQQNQKTERSKRRLPAKMLDERVRNPWHRRAAQPDSQIRESHRLPARSFEPTRQYHLVWQRPSEDISQRVQHVEKIKHAERRDAS